MTGEVRCGERALIVRCADGRGAAVKPRCWFGLSGDVRAAQAGSEKISFAW
ncbi:hypothetical protein [Pantoea septica]|uniref:hypothetical protein n=1 Tax=Pantoea septica TaxID=472695 RepID=UPI003D06AFF0